MINPLVIYHANCDDGFGAALVCREFFGTENVDFHPGVYQEEAPDVTGRDVILVDFSYKRSVLEEMAKVARSILILDHHKTAQADLANLGTYASWGDHIAQGGIHVLFDMDRSGAGIAWDYFMGSDRRSGEPAPDRPEFINYLEDRDLWRKELPGGDEFTIALRSYPQDFDVWMAIASRPVGELIAQGRPIQRYYRQQVEAMKANAYSATITFGYDAPTEEDRHAVDSENVEVTIANAPYAFASEVAGELAEETGIGACFFQLADGRWQYSLRSRNGVDVTPIALAFGGGGHAAAAGFTVPEPVHIPVPLSDDEVED